jgi:hypothetical protein
VLHAKSIGNNVQERHPGVAFKVAIRKPNSGLHADDNAHRMMEAPSKIVAQSLN